VGAIPGIATPIIVPWIERGGAAGATDAVGAIPGIATPIIVPFALGRFIGEAAGPTGATGTTGTTGAGDGFGAAVAPWLASMGTAPATGSGAKPIIVPLMPARPKLSAGALGLAAGAGAAMGAGCAKPTMVAPARIRLAASLGSGSLRGGSMTVLA
jgi:hypothetical protein